jgi:RNA polymerase sigma factor (sigma-70 family)
MGTHVKSNLTALKTSTTNEFSEAEAVRLAQEGNSDGFERLYQLHSRWVYGLCLRVVKNPIDAEDLTQDAFLQAFRKIQTFRGDSHFSTWLHRVAVNIVLMRLRKRKHSESSVESRKRFMEISEPDLNWNGVIDRINWRMLSISCQGCKKMHRLTHPCRNPCRCPRSDRAACRASPT